MEDFATSIGETDVQAPVTNAGDGMPRLWWRNGESQKKNEPGFFYTDDSQFPAGLGDPWKAEQVYPNNPEQGYVALKLGLAIIGFRWNAFRKVNQNGQERKVWLKDWVAEPGVSIQTDMLCFVRGAEHGQLCVLSVKGLTGKTLTGRYGILPTYRASFLKEACAVASKRLPDWTFWLPIAVAMKADGKTVDYRDTGHKSTYTPPALYLPKEDAFNKLYVGRELLELGAAAYEGNQDWLKEKFYLSRGGSSQAQADDSPAEDEDLPF